MKKCLAFSVLLGLLGAAAFADGSLTIQGKADMVLMPLQIVSQEIAGKDDLYLGAGLGRNGDTKGPRIRLDVAGNMDDKIGFRAELRFFDKDKDGNTQYFDFGDWANVWWQPLPMLKFDVGEFNGDVLRGKVGNDNWHEYTVGAYDEDAIFKRFRGDLGALIGLTPIPGLYAGVLVPDFKPFVDGGSPNMTAGSGDGNGNANAADDETTDKNSSRALRVYERIQVGVGYDLGMGLVRAQFVGANSGFDPKLTLEEIADLVNLSEYGKLVTTLSAPRFELAFAFTGMEGLVIDFGAKAYLPISDWVTDNWNPADEEYTKASNTGTFWKGLQFALGAKFNLGALNIGARVDALNIAANYEADGVDYKYKVGPTINFHLWPSYNLGILEAGLDFGLAVKLQDSVEMGSNTVDAENGDFRIGGGLWAKKSFGNGSIKGGVALSTGSANDGDYKYPLVVSIPIVFDYSF